MRFVLPVVAVAACATPPSGPPMGPLTCTASEPAGILYAVECNSSNENALCFSPDNTGL